MRSVNGSVAAITGAGSGIGRATAIALAKKGAALALSDISERGLAETVERLPPGTHVTTRVVDVAKIEEVEAWAREVEHHFGRTSILMNIAGVGLYGQYKDYARADLEWIMGVNFWGPVNGAQAFLPMLEREPAANIVTISSLNGLIAPAGQTGYCASKFAVRGFYEALRHELRESSVSVTVVHPGGVATNIARTSRAAAKADTTYKAADTERFEKLLRMPPSKAADLIVRAVETNKKRLIVGVDAQIFQMLQRIFPSSYYGIIAKILPSADTVAIARERAKLAASEAAGSVRSTVGAA